MTFTTSDQEQPNQGSEGLDCLRKFALGAHAHHTRRKSLQAIRHMGWLSILSMLVAATVAAQDKPDFSGRWILETSVPAGPDVARSLTVRQTVVRTNVYGAPNVWPGDTTGISTLSPTEVAVTWGSAVMIGGQPKSQIFAAVLDFEMP